MATDKEMDLYERVLKSILATNYYYQILDGLVGTSLYRQKLKNLLKQVEAELDQAQKHEAVRTFYRMADHEIHLNNVELHEEFFVEFSRQTAEEMAQNMKAFLKHRQVLKDDEIK